MCIDPEIPQSIHRRNAGDIGTPIPTSLEMTRVESPVAVPSRWKSARHWIALAVLAVSLAATALSWVMAERRDQEYKQAHFAYHATHGEARLVLLAGLAVSLLLSSLVWSLAQLRHRADLLAREMTDALRRAHAERAQAAAQHLAEREVLSNVLTHIPHLIFWKDLNSVYLGCNQALAEAAGLASISEAVGKTDYELPWTREQSDYYRVCDQKVMQTGEPMLDIEETLRTEEGQDRFILTHKVALRDSSGRIFGMVGIASDETERKRAEQTLRTRLAAIDAAADMVVITDRAGIIEYVNPAFTTATGYTAAEVIGQNPRFLSSGTHDKDFYQNMWAKILGGQSWCGEMENRRKDGTVYPEEMTITPVKDLAGQVVRFVAIKRDISSRRERAALEQERQSLKQAVKAMDQVLGVLGHELRTPLAGVRAMSEFLLDAHACDTRQSEQFLASINGEVIRMADTINNLLEAARINSGRARWNWGEVALAEVCEEALETVRPLVDSHQVSMTLGVVPPDVQMAGDAEAIRRLVVNLLSNARKYTAKGSIQLQVTAATDSEGSWVHLEVTDTGRGISSALAARLGEAFALNAGVVGINQIEGTGLGLAICKGIAAAHGGSLSVCSVEGKGTTILARLRADLPSAAAADVGVAMTMNLITPARGSK